MNDLPAGRLSPGLAGPEEAAAGLIFSAYPVID